MRQMKMKHFALYACIFNCVCIFGVGAASYFMLNDAVDSIYRLGEKNQRVDQVNHFQGSIFESIVSLYSLILFQNWDDFDSTLQALQKSNQEVENYLQLEKSDDIDDRYEIPTLEAMGKNIQLIAGQLEDFYHRQDNTAMNSKQLAILKARGLELRDQVENINKIHLRNISSLIHKSTQEIYNIIALYIFFSGAGIIASFAGYYLLNRTILDPVDELVVVTEKVAEGDLNQRLHTDLNNEIGVLYASFDSMIEKLQRSSTRQADMSGHLEELVRQRTIRLEEKEKILRQAQKALIRMERVATLGQIATSVNHEIKTPLNVLAMNVQILQRKIDKWHDKATVSADLRESMSDWEQIVVLIAREVERINTILEEFVSYARISMPNPRPQNMNQVIHHVAENIQERLKEANVLLELKLEDGSDVFIDEDKISQALLNLCINAIDAMPYGGALKISTLFQKDEMYLLVADNGIGIDEREQVKIFDPFYTKKEGGMGLGLAIVKRIVEDHYGSIVCLSSPGRGTTFTITLPLQAGSRMPKRIEEEFGV